MGMYKQFTVDRVAEREGVRLQYEGFRVTVARAAPTNPRYRKALETLMRPHRRAMATGTLADKKEQEILRALYSGTVITNWEVTDDEGATWQQGIEMPDGTVGPFNRQNVELALQNLPDLFMDIRKGAEDSALFRAVEQEDVGKN